MEFPIKQASRQYEIPWNHQVLFCHRRFKTRRPFNCCIDATVTCCLCPRIYDLLTHHLWYVICINSRWSSRRSITKNVFVTAICALAWVALVYGIIRVSVRLIMLFFSFEKFKNFFLFVFSNRNKRTLCNQLFGWPLWAYASHSYAWLLFRSPGYFSSIGLSATSTNI